MNQKCMGECNWTSSSAKKGKSMEKDRVVELKNRIMQLKMQSVDPQFSQYLDQTWMQLLEQEKSLDQLARCVEQNYVLYQRKNMTAPIPPVQPMPQPPVQPIPPATAMWGEPQPEWKLPESRNRTEESGIQFGESNAIVPPSEQKSKAPLKVNNTVEFKVGSIIFAVVGIAFLLVAFITLGLNYMNSLLQGMFLYLIAGAILLVSELFFQKKNQKFSFCMTGLSVSSLYVATILNYLYLKVFPGWVALLITILIAGLSLFLSRKRDSGVMRLICVIGCYVSLVPVHRFSTIQEFVIPAVIILLMNLACIFYPVRKKQIGINAVQHGFSIALSLYLTSLLWMSGLPSWPMYLFVAVNLVLSALFYFRNEDCGGNRAILLVEMVISLGLLLFIGYSEAYLLWAFLGVTVLAMLCTVLFWKRWARFVPFYFWASYLLLACLFDGMSLYFCIAALVIFLVTRVLAGFFKELAVTDSIYTMFCVLIVLFGMRGSELEIVGYIFAAALLFMVLVTQKFRSYHIFTALSFIWLFLVSERNLPFVCSILLAVIAALAIGYGFWQRSKGVRIYGLILMLMDAIKIAVFDFGESQPAVRILVFCVVGVIILGVAYLYLYLEKQQQQEQEKQEQQQQEQEKQQQQGN